MATAMIIGAVAGFWLGVSFSILTFQNLERTAQHMRQLGLKHAKVTINGLMFALWMMGFISGGALLGAAIHAMI